MSFWRPKPGTILRYNGTYRNWLGDLIEKIDEWGDERAPYFIQYEEHIMVGSVVKDGREYVRVVNHRGIQDVLLLAGMDIDLALVRRPIIVGTGLLVVLLMGCIWGVLRKILS